MRISDCGMKSNHSAPPAYGRSAPRHRLAVSQPAHSTGCTLQTQHQATARALLTLIVWFITAQVAVAAPSLGQIMPRGGSRGTEIVVDFTGARLGGAQEILFHEPGITVKKLEQKNGKHVQVTLAIAADCPLGPHAMRVRTLRGLTELRIFTVRSQIS